MALLLKSQVLLATLAALTTQISADKLYVYSNRIACVNVDSQDTCPVSWKLPSFYALTYNINVNAIDAQPLLIDVVDSYKSKQYCELGPTGKHKIADCVAPDGMISGVCPQPKYKMPEDRLEIYKSKSSARVETFRTLEQLKDVLGNPVFSPECLTLIKGYDCVALYCSKDNKSLLVENDFEDCEETRKCYMKAASVQTSLKNGQEYFNTKYKELDTICPTLPKRGTAKLEEPAEFTSAAARGVNGRISKILFLMLAVFFGYYR